MQGSGSRARMTDLKSMHSRHVSLQESASNAALVHSSSSSSAPPTNHQNQQSEPQQPRPPPASQPNPGITSMTSLRASAASLLSTSASSFHLSSSRSLRPSLQTKSYKSIGVACEIRLKEAIERSRVADRLLRSANMSESRTDAEGLIDRSISALAIVLFEILHEQREAFGSANAYTQFVSVLDQLMWSSQTRVVSIEQSPLQSPTHTSSSSSLALNKSLPSSPPVTVVERITNYELNLLHTRNDESWRNNYMNLAERESQISKELDALTRENEELKADMAIFAQETATARDQQRELERIIQSLDGRLHIAQQEYEKLGAKMAALQDYSSEQQETIILSRQELISTRKEAEEAKASFINNETTELLTAQVHTSEKEVLKMEEQVSSINKLYYAMMASCHKAIQKKDSLASELEVAKQEIESLRQTKAEILRPYTPRPEWRKIYRSHPCELTPTFLLTTSDPSTDQIHSLLDYLSRKNTEIEAQQKTLEQTIEVQTQTKKDLAKAKRDLEIAIRSGLAGAGGGGGNGRGGAGGGNGDDSTQRMGMSTLYMKPKSTSRYFVAMGNGKEVPPFLRCNNGAKIRNRHLSKKDTEMVVREVWQRKIAHDRERGRLDLNLSDFFYFFLKNKYGLPSLVAEWGYNMLDALERYRWDADCELFLKILIGEISEEAYYDQLLLMHTITNLFIQLEIIRSERKALNLIPGAIVSQLPLEFLSKSLRLLFPYKPDEAFESIMTALMQCFADSPKSSTDYSELFRENRTMNETGFVEEIRDQHLYEIENFMIQLTEEIVLLPREENGAGEEGGEEDQPTTVTNPDGSATTIPPEGRVRMYDIHNAWIRLDPQITVEMMDKYISRALRLPIGPNGIYPPVDPTTLVRPTEFCKALFSSSLIKYTSNFDPSACMKLSSLPLPDALPSAAATAAAAAAAAAAEEKENGGGANKAAGSGGDAATAAAAAASAASTAAILASGGLKSSRSKARLERRGTWNSADDDAGGTAGGVGGGKGGPPKDKKDNLLFTSPKILRLRTRFGLEARPEEILFLERGPNFQDPTSMKTNEKEVDTLMNEKAQLDDQRMNEKIRLKEAAETSKAAIQGIGVTRRRQTVAANDVALAAAAALAKAAAAATASATSTEGAAPSSTTSDTATDGSTGASAPVSSDSAVSASTSSAPVTVTVTADAAATSVSSSSDPSIPIQESKTADSESAVPRAADPTAKEGGLLKPAVSSPTHGTRRTVSFDNSAQEAPMTPQQQQQPLSPSSTTGGSGVFSPTSPLSPSSASSTGSSQTQVPITPRYKSSFFVAPSIHAEQATHEKPAVLGPPGSMKSPNAAFKRRYTERRKSSVEMEGQSSAGAIAAAVATAAAQTTATGTTQKRSSTKGKAGITPAANPSATTTATTTTTTTTTAPGTAAAASAVTAEEK